MLISKHFCGRISKAATISLLLRSSVRQQNNARNLTLRVKDRPNTFADEAAIEKKAFVANYPRIVRDVTANDTADDEFFFGDLLEKYQEILDYNVPHGELMHGLTLIKTYAELKRPQSLTDEEVFLTHTLGWAFEMARAFANVVDDITDGSNTRYGKPCWHMKEGLGVQALNDAILIQAGVSNLIRKHFSKKPYYAKLLEHINEFYWEAHVGQSLDILFVRSYQKTRYLEPFTMDTAMDMGGSKTCTALYIPIALGMRMAGVDDPIAYTQAKHVCKKMAQFYTVQNDVMDSFGDLDETGKMGSDIEEGKCTWLTVKAIQLANKEQLKIIKENNGKKDARCVQKMRDLFLELQLPKLYEVHAQNSYEHIVDLVTSKTFKMPASIFLFCFQFLYRGPNNNKNKLN